MITNIKIVDPKFKARTDKSSLDFVRGVNLLTGPNGSGKSSLIEALKHEIDVGDHTVARLIRDPSVPVMFYSGEDATIKLGTKPPAHDDGDLTARHQSHGQGLRSYLEALNNIDGEAVVVMDEPETALDFFAVNDLCQMISQKSETVQFIISSHHPLFFTMKRANMINMDRTEANYAGRVLARLRKRISVT